MITLTINRIKDLIEEYTNLPLYSFLDIKPDPKNINMWVVTGQVVVGADTAKVYTREIQVKIGDLDTEINLISLDAIGTRSYNYTFACNKFQPPISRKSGFFASLRARDGRDVIVKEKHQ